MTRDVADRVAAALRGVADGETDADALLHRTLAHGRRRRRRHRLIAIAGVGFAVAAVAALLPIMIRSGVSQPAGSIDEAHSVPALRAAGRTGGTQDGSRIGADPLVIHFGFRDLPLPVQVARWSVDGGMEQASLDMRRPDGRGASLQMSLRRAKPPAADPTTPSGSEGAAPSASSAGRGVTDEPAALRWSPARDVEAVLVSSSLTPSERTQFRDLVRFDTSTGCAVPLQLSALPAGARVTGCAVTLPGDVVTRPGDVVDSGPQIEARLTLEANRTGSVDVRVTAEPTSAAEAVGPLITLPGGIPAVWSENVSVDLTIFDLAGRWVQVRSPGGTGRDHLLRIASALRPAGDPGRPETWPADPVT